MSEVDAPKRRVYYDVLKGIAITLVVVGHAIQFHVADFDDNWAFRVIYAFHMPLFMFVSGAVAASGTQVSCFNEFVWKKASRLLIPFVSWAMLFGYLIGGKYGKETPLAYMLGVIKRPDIGLWFLWVLFFLHLSLRAACELERKVGRWSFAIVLIGILLIPMHAFGVPLIKTNAVYFFVGFLVRRDWSAIRRYQRLLWIASVLTFPVLVAFWRRNLPPSFIQDSGVLPYAFGKAYTAVTAFMGIICCSMVGRWIERSKRNRVLAYVGRASLEIYYLQFYFVASAFDALVSPIGSVGWAWLVAIYSTAALSACLALRHALTFWLPVLNTLLFGAPWRSRDLASNAAGAVR